MGRRICFSMVICFFEVAKLQIWGAEPRSSLVSCTILRAPLQIRFFYGRSYEFLLPGFCGGFMHPTPPKLPLKHRNNNNKQQRQLNDQTSIIGRTAGVVNRLCPN